jgi:homoserine dehydrogenase
VGSNPTLSASPLPCIGPIPGRCEPAVRQDHTSNSRSVTQKTVNLVLVGYGHVGRAFYLLLREKRQFLASRYGLHLEARAVFRSSGGAIAGSLPLGEDPEVLTWDPELQLKALLEDIERGVLVECTPSNIRTGEPGLTHIKRALDSGWHVVTANKGPLVVDFKGLKDRAAQRGLALRFSCAAAAALPTLDVGMHSLAGAEILSLEGILNGTTNHILTRMSRGTSYAEALRDAQAKGIAETNPSLDVEGWDTAAKLLLIAAAVMEIDLALEDIKVQGITDLSQEVLDEAAAKGQSLKLLGRVCREGGEHKADVSVTALNRSHPLFGVNGTDKGISYSTDTMGTVTITGGKSDPRAAAAALLKDVVNIFK